MPLPDPYLDDLRFQRDLVDEARRRIIRYCPEWTDYNVSDPGITLIELFSWMTEQIVYRLNRVPEKTHIKFLELLGVRLQPASSARTELTFYLSTPFPISPDDPTTAVIPQGTEVATRRTEQEEEVIFTTDRRLEIRAPRLTQLRRDADVNTNYLPRLGTQLFYPFNQHRPEIGDTFYLGFDPNEDIRGHILQLHVLAERTQAPGIKRDDPPLVWEVAIGEGQWQEVAISQRPAEKDSTGGLNNPEGSLTLYLPRLMAPSTVHGRVAYWLRCRHAPRDEATQGRYAESPRLKQITASALGGTVDATHAVIVHQEMLGESSGEPGQTFRLKHIPVLDLEPGESVEVEEVQRGDLVFIPWTLVEDFARSNRHDRHYTLDTRMGEVAFGPSIRQPDGSVRQYGRVPETGRRVRFTRYRYGGGVLGNVPAGKLQVLKSTIPYVDQVINLQRATGGRDAETLEEAKMRARREMRAQQRAVTAEDYESLVLRASRAVARARCQAPSTRCSGLAPGVVELLVVPDAREALRAGDLSKLQVDPPLQDQIRAFLDPYRLLTTTLHIRAPRYLGIRVEAEIVPAPWSAPEVVQARALETLCRFLSPLDLLNEGTRAGPGQETADDIDRFAGGWPFGHDLYVTDLYALLQRVEGVKHVRDVRLSLREVIPHQEQGGLPPDEGERDPERPLEYVTDRIVQVATDTLVCSLRHAVTVVEPQ